MHAYRPKPGRLAVAIHAALLTCLAPAALAQRGAIEEIIVTAEKREESMQNTPIAMAALSSEDLERQGIQDFSGVAASSPSVSFAPFPTSSDTLILFIRAQGNGDPGQITKDGAVGLYQDGIYIARAQGSTLDLADVERVEVLRGPQGTLYGRNTTGGAVNIITKKPSGEFAFKQTLSAGSRNSFRSLTSIDLPAWGDVAAKVSLLKSSVDGYVKNPGSSHDFGEQAQQAGRLALRWNVSDAAVVDYAFETGKLYSTQLYYANRSLLGTVPGYNLDRDRAYRAVDLDRSEVDYQNHGLTLEWELNDSLTFKSLTGYRELEAEYFADFAESFGFPYRNNDVIKGHQFSQEFQLNGSALDDRLAYSTGLYYFSDANSHYANPVVFNGASVTERDVSASAESRAIYGQVTWTPAVLDDRLSLTLGGRYTRDERDAERDRIVNGNALELNASNSQRFKRFNPAFTVGYQVSEDISAYAKVATGYRAGGSSERDTDFTNTFGPEKVTTYEVGLKSYWWQRQLRANLAVFSTDYEDMQIDASIDNDPTLAQTINAGRSTISGFELDVLVAPTENLNLSLTYAYLDPDLEEVEVDGVDVTGGYAIPFAPRHSVNAGVDYTLFRFDGGELFLRADYQYQASILTSGVAGPSVRNHAMWERPSYGLFSGRIGAAFDLPRGDRARIALWGKNLADKEYKTYVTGNGNPIAGYTSQAYALGEPRSYGIELTYQY